MRSCLIFIAILLCNAAAHGSSTEERLADLQLEEAALLARFRPQTPNVIETQAEIEKLLEIPNIKNQIYFDYLKQRKADLTAERQLLASRLREGDISLTIIEAKITRADSLLKK